MARVKRGVTARARHKKVLRQAKGYVGRSSNTYRPALERLEKALRYAYRDRRNKKREFRALWIQRINAGAREEGLTYSQFMNGIKKAGIAIDRKVLADLAVTDPDGFKALVSQAKAALA
ncbi:MAG TPA: 50S ribosomal protein L20 [Alphaproteobacteria bacterium]